MEKRTCAFKSTDGGASWAPINNGLAGAFDSRSTVTAIAFAAGYRSTLYHGDFRKRDLQKASMASHSTMG